MRTSTVSRAVLAVTFPLTTLYLTCIMQHEHLKFYNNSSAQGATNTAFGASVPVVNFGPSQVKADSGSSGNRLLVDHARIVEYLKQLPAHAKAGFLDVQRDLGIDLQLNTQLVEKLKSAEKLDYGHDNDGSFYFQYRHKYPIENKRQLLQLLGRVGHGVLLSDIESCYIGLKDDVMNMIRAGELIAAQNKEKRTLVLFSRGDSFLSELSADVTAHPRDQIVVTAGSLENQVRRGEAVRVGNFWYRVSTTVQGSANGQPQRAAAPLSVTLDKDLSDRNVYVLPYTAEALPLDGEFEEAVDFHGKAVKHGATNDVKAYWNLTAEDIKAFDKDEMKLVDELVQHKLTSQGRHSAAYKKTHVVKEKVQKKRKQREGLLFQGVGSNSHLLGTKIGALLQKSGQK